MPFAWRDLLPLSRRRHLRRKNRSHKQLVRASTPGSTPERSGSGIAAQALAAAARGQASRKAAEVDRVVRARAWRRDAAAFVLQSHWRAHARWKTRQMEKRRDSFPAPPPRIRAETRRPSFEFELPTPPRLPAVLRTPPQSRVIPPATPPSLDEVAAVVVQASARRRAAQQRRVAMEANASKARPLELEHQTMQNELTQPLELEHQTMQNELTKALQTMVRHLPTPPLPPTPCPCHLARHASRAALHAALLTPAGPSTPICRRGATSRSVNTRRSGSSWQS